MKLRRVKNVTINENQYNPNVSTVNILVMAQITNAEFMHTSQTTLGQEVGSLAIGWAVESDVRTPEKSKKAHYTVHVYSFKTWTA